MNVRFLGHASFELTHEGTTVLIDPWLTDNPKAACAADDLAADTILVTHGHVDHVRDVVSIANRTGADVVCTQEVAQDLLADGLTKDPLDLNYGGTQAFDWGWARLVPAWHATTTDRGTKADPAGVVVAFGGRVVYHLGDTCLFSDLALPGARDAIDVAIVPIGGHFTMDRVDAVEAVRFVGARQVIPCHYGTFPPIETDVAAFADEAGKAGSEVVVLAPGETHEA